MLVASRQSPELGIADFLVKDYVDGLNDLGWNLDFEAGRRDCDAGVAVFYHPYHMEGILRDIDDAIPVIVIQDTIVDLSESLFCDPHMVKHIPPGLTRDQIVNMMDEYLSELFGGKND